MILLCWFVKCVMWVVNCNSFFCVSVLCCCVLLWMCLNVVRVKFKLWMMKICDVLNCLMMLKKCCCSGWNWNLERWSSWWMVCGWLWIWKSWLGSCWVWWSWWRVWCWRRWRRRWGCFWLYLKVGWMCCCRLCCWCCGWGMDCCLRVGRKWWVWMWNCGRLSWTNLRRSAYRRNACVWLRVEKWW